MPSVRQVLVETVLQSLPVGLLVIDPRGRLMTASHATAALLGLPGEGLKHASWRVLLRAEPENEAFNRTVTEAVESGREFRHSQVDYRSPDGTVHHFAVTTSAAAIDGKPIGVTIILDDVTALTRSRERETAVLREKNRLQHDMIESLNNLALCVAHQIRNPAAAIGGFSLKLLSYLKEQDLSTEYPEIIFQEARRLEDIVGAVVRLSSLPHPHLERTNLKLLAESAVAKVTETAVALHKKVAWEIDLAEAAVQGDPGMLGQALAEVLLNAVEFSGRERVKVKVTLTRRDEEVLITVTDDGPGIRQDLRPFLFDPFFTTKVRGAGIGLTLARKVVLEHNGELAVKSLDGQGTAVTFRLFDTPETGLAHEAFAAPSGLEVRELKTKARDLGVDISGLTTIDAVRAIQTAEGYDPCFAWGLFDSCGQIRCTFRRECAKMLRIDESCRITYEGGQD